ncbi:MAG: leucyl aminopeptidase, partial [Bacteroidetes bacterium]|nr:leucyl aminopeptidase [Bacteroidota bacterium]
MTITLNARLGTLPTAKADVITCFLWEDVTAFKRQIKELRKTVKGITPALDAATFAAKELETLLLYPDNLKAKRLLLVGLGKQGAITREKLRRAAAAATKATRGAKAKSLALIAPEINLDSSSDIKSWEVVGTALGEGAILSQYRFDKYLTQEKKSTNLTQVAVVSSRTAQVGQIASGLKLAEIVCAGTVLARDLENAPGNEIYPDSLARRAVAVGKKAKVKVTVLNERAISRL